MADEQVVEQEQPVVETDQTAAQEDDAAETDPVAPAEPAKPEPTEIEKKLQAAEREVERHRKRADYAFSQMDVLSRQQQQQPAKPDPEPKEDEFGENTLAYAKAWSAWNAREVVRQDHVERQAESRQQIARTRQEAFVQERSQRIEEAAQADPQVWGACDALGKMGVVVGTPFQDALHESDNFEGLVKHLAANPQEVQRILLLPPVRQVKEIARLETQLSTPASPPPPPLRTSQAPPPAKPLNGASASTAAIDLNDPNVPIDVWMKEHDRRELAKLRKTLR